MATTPTAQGSASSTKRAASSRPSTKTAAIQWNADAPEPCQAGQIAFAMMRRAKVTTWAQLYSVMQENPEVAVTVWLTNEQQRIVERYAHLLPFLSVSGSTVGIVACPACGEYGLHDKRPVPASCYFTLGCSGKLARSALTEAARKTGTETEPPTRQPVVEVVVAAATPAPAQAQTPQQIEEAAAVSQEREAEQILPSPAAAPTVTARHVTSEPPAAIHPVSSSFVAIDFELGSSAKSSPVQVGMARVIDGVVVDTYVGYVCPPEPVAEFGPWQRENLPFGPEVQFDAPTWADTLDLIAGWATVSNADGSSRMLPLVAHNAASTERHVIAKTSAAAGIVPPEFMFACTMQVAKDLDKGAGKYGLDVLAARYGIDLADHHDAGADALATAHLALRLLAVDGGRGAFKASLDKIRAMGGPG